MKTNSDGANKWILTKKAEEYISANHVYIFAAIKGLGERPEYRIVPSERVARQIKEGHQNWLQGKKSNGQPRKDSNIMNYHDFEDEYLEAWEIIEKLLTAWLQINKLVNGL